MNSKKALEKIKERLFLKENDYVKTFIPCILKINQDLDRLEELEKHIIEQRKIVLLTKDMVYFDTFTEKYFLDFVDFLIDNEVYCHIDTIYGLTEVWFSNCGKRILHKLIIEFNSKEANNDK